MTQEEWQAVIDTNLTGVFNVCKLAAEKISDGGRIINFSSISPSRVSLANPTTPRPRLELPV